jgi:DNA-binding transcriptional ArsR family regulator
MAMPKSKSPAPHELSDEALALIAGRFKLLSEVLRLKLLIQLQQNEKNVSELVAATGATQTNVSRHLQALAEAGILSRRKEGQNAYYQISDPGVFDLCKHVCGSLQRRFEEQAKAARLFVA